jgi:hypothetical protein
LTAFVVFDPARDFWRAQLVLNVGAFTALRVPTRREWRDLHAASRSRLAHWVDDRLAASDLALLLVGRDTLDLPVARLVRERAGAFGTPIVGLDVSSLAHVDGTREASAVHPSGADVWEDLAITDLWLGPEPSASTGHQLRVLERGLEPWLRRAVAPAGA